MSNDLLVPSSRLFPIIMGRRSAETNFDGTTGTRPPGPSTLGNQDVSETPDVTGIATCRPCKMELVFTDWRQPSAFEVLTKEAHSGTAPIKTCHIPSPRFAGKVGKNPVDSAICHRKDQSLGNVQRLRTNTYGSASQSFDLS